MSEISAGRKWFLLGAMILSGAANTIVYKAQNSSVTKINGQDYAFNHPFMQALTMFIGEFSVIIAFLIQSKSTAKRRAEYEQDKEEAAVTGKSVSFKKYFYLIIPASSDFCTSTLQYIALNYINPSIYQMLRGGVILVTALFSKCFLKKTIHKHMIIGCATVFVGIGLVGSSSMIFPEKDAGGKSSTAQAIAMGLIVLSLLFNGCLFVSEEFLFGKFLLVPFQVVGTEGFWGVLIYSIVIPILSNVSCPMKSLSDSCVIYPFTPGNDKLNQHNSHFESPALFGEQFKDAGLGTLIVLGILTIAIFNVCGVNVTKYINSLTRSIADVSRTLIVWIVSIIITVTLGHDNTHYKWENLKTGAIILEIFGFVILVAGNFIYNGIWVLPFAPLPQTDDDIEEQIQSSLIKDISLQEPGVEDSDYAQKKSFNKNKSFQKRSMGRDSFHS